MGKIETEVFYGNIEIYEIFNELIDLKFIEVKNKIENHRIHEDNQDESINKISKHSKEVIG